MLDDRRRAEILVKGRHLYAFSRKRHPLVRFIYNKKPKLTLYIISITIIMATITLWVNVEEALIEAGVKRRKWAEYVNNASIEKLEREKDAK